MKFLIPLVLALVGLVGGAAAGYFLKPAPHLEPAPCLDEHGAAQPPEACASEEELAMLGEPTEEADGLTAYVDMERQFIIPLVAEGRVDALMVMTLAIEVDSAAYEEVALKKPKLRDAMLKSLFDHAYSGGFNGDFTAEYVMRDLRRSLIAASRRVAGEPVRNVLVTDIIKQEQ